jgi:hypothetical protein
MAATMATRMKPTMPITTTQTQSMMMPMARVP